MEEGHRKRCREHSQKHLPRKPQTEMICPYCGELYMTSRDDSVSCPEKKCKNEYRRANAKKKYDAMSPEERRAHRKRQHTASELSAAQYKKVEGAWVKCRCPGCNAEHTRHFPYGYRGKTDPLPRFNCDNFPGCVSDNIGTVIYEVYQGGNRCRI
jgi:ribosomal protein S27E